MRTWFIVGLILLLTAGLAWAVVEHGSLSGTVMDSDGNPLPGVTVTADSPNQIGGAKVAVTDENGEFRFPKLMVGTYSVSFNLEGFQLLTNEQVPVNLDRNTKLSVTMQLASEFETEIVVSGQAPVVDSTQTNTGDVYTQDFLQEATIGSGGRSFQNVMGMSAGVQGGGNPSVLGSTEGENSYLIDGMDSTDPVTSTFGTNFNFDAIQEISFQTGGFEAEYGRALGGVVNVVTKSGGNTFSGTFDIRYQDESFTEDGENPVWDPYDPSQDTYKFYNPNATIGGPLLRDRVWFFVAVGHEMVKQTPWQAYSNYEWDAWSNLGKITWQVNPNNTIIGKYSFDWAYISNWDAGPYTAPEAGMRQDQMTRVAQIDYSSILSENTLFSLKLGSAYQDLDVYPTNEDYDSPQYIDLLTGLAYNGGYLVQLSERDRVEGMTSLTYYKDNFLGDHTLKAGLEYHDLKFDSVNRYNGAPYTFSYEGQQYTAYPLYYTDHWDDCYRTDVNGDGVKEEVCPDNEYAEYWQSGLGPDGKWHDADPDEVERAFWSGDFGVFDGELWTGYLQDEWRIRPNLTFKPGVRFDQATYWDDLGNEVITFDMVQPRLGLAWDIFNDSKTVFRAYWGRFMHPGALTLPDFVKQHVSVSGTETYAGQAAYQAGLLDENGQGDWQAYCEIFGYECDENGYFVTDFFGGEPNQVLKDLKPTYADEFSIGFEREIMPCTGIEVTYVNKRTKDIIEDTCAGYDENGNFIDPGDPSTWPLDENGDPYWGLEYCGSYMLRNPAAAKRYYYGYLLKLESRYKDWFHIIVNYTYSKSRGSIEYTQYGGTDLDIPLHYTNIYGYMSDDRRHRVKINGYFYLPLETSLGFNFFWGSGLSQNFTSSYRYYPVLDYGSYFIEPRGSRRNQSLYSLDVEARKDFKIGDRIDARVILSVNNVINNQGPTDRCYSYQGVAIGEGFTPEEVTDAAEGSCGYWGTLDRPASWGFTDSWYNPRSYEVGFRLEF